MDLQNFSILANVEATAKAHCRSPYLSSLLICFIFIAIKIKKTPLQIIYIKYIILLEITFPNTYASPTVLMILTSPLASQTHISSPTSSSL